MNNLTEQLKAWWDGSTVPTRIIAAGLAAMLVVCIGVAGALATAPTYTDLFTNLAPDDAAAIAQKLDDEHEKYQYAEGQTTIQVPAPDKDRLRMEMVRNGLPAKSGKVLGSEWLDKIGMGTTTDVQNQYIRLATEGELSQTIGSLTEVASASVHITAGNDSPFASSVSPASASVVVSLKPNTTLTGDQVMGVANLVAKSVPDRDVKNVVVMDGAGTPLWDGNSDANGPGGAGSGKLAAERQYSEDMRRQMQTHLDEVLGPRKSLVSVSSELNYNQVSTTQTTFVKGPLVSTSESAETYSGSGGSGVGGVSGSGANSPTGSVTTYGSGAGEGKGGQYSKTDNVADYSPGKIETETHAAPGQVQRLAVAVLIDQSVAPATIATIQNYLSNQAGVVPGDPSRAVTVQSVSFSNAAALSETKELAAVAAAQRTDLMIKCGVVVLVLGSLLFIMTRTTRSVTIRGARQLALEGAGGSGRAHSLTMDPDKEQLTGESSLSIDALERWFAPIRSPWRCCSRVGLRKKGEDFRTWAIALV